MMTNSIRQLVLPLFPLGSNEIDASRGGKVSEKPDAETGSREAGIFRHQLAETAMRGLAEHISPLFTVRLTVFTSAYNDRLLFLFKGFTPRYCSHWYLRRTTLRRCRGVSHAEPKFPSTSTARLGVSLRHRDPLVKRPRGHPSEYRGRRIYR